MDLRSIMARHITTGALSFDSTSAHAIIIDVGEVERENRLRLDEHARTFKSRASSVALGKMVLFGAVDRREGQRVVVMKFLGVLLLHAEVKPI